MDWRNPSQTLIYQHGKNRCYLSIKDDDGKTITLKDSQTGVEYAFTSSQLEQLIAKRLIYQTDAVEPFVDKKSSQLKAQDEAQFERRLAYVIGAFSDGKPLNGQALSLYIELKAIELEDDRPPSSKSLYRWIKLYSNQGETALYPNRSASGNRTPRLSTEHEKLLVSLLSNGTASNKAALHRQYSLAATNHGFTPISYEAFRKRGSR